MQALRVSSTAPAAVELCDTAATGAAGFLVMLSAASPEIGRVAAMNRPRPTMRLYDLRCRQVMMEFSSGESWWTASFCGLHVIERDRDWCNGSATSPERSECVARAETRESIARLYLEGRSESARDRVVT